MNEECDDLLDKAEKKFIEAFETVSSWPIPNRNLDKATSDSICSNLKSISSDFSTLKEVWIFSTLQCKLLFFTNFRFFHTYLTNYLQVLQARDEISKVILPKELPKTSTPLNAIIEDIVINNEELENLSMKNDSVYWSVLCVLLILKIVYSSRFKDNLQYFKYL